MHTYNYEHEYYDFYEKCFDYFDHPQLMSLFSLNVLSLNQKSIMIRFLNQIWLAPKYDYLDTLFIEPLNNYEYSAFCRNIWMERRNY